MLRNFTHADDVDDASLRYYNNLGEWHDHLELTHLMDEIYVPVYYCTSFVVRTKRLVQKSKLYQSIIKSIESDLKRHNQIEVVEFLERTWASILSYPLSKRKVKTIADYATGMDKPCCRTGSLLHKISDSDVNFFKGDTLIRQDEDYSKLRLTILIAHFNEDMSWMRQCITELKVPIRDVTIYSKCNNVINGYTPPSSKIVSMRNVGRCDHTYASWMANMDENSFNEDDLILFIKSSRIAYEKGLSYRNIHDVM